MSFKIYEVRTYSPKINKAKKNKTVYIVYVYNLNYILINFLI